MKAKKSLIITLFAAVLAFAFGATMVFAAATPSWNEDYSKVTIGADTYNADRTVQNFASDGLVTATINLDGYSEGSVVDLAKSMGFTGSDGVAAKAFVVKNATVKYYDLSKATVKIAKVMTQPEMDAMYDADKDAWKAAPALTLSVPDYVKDYNTYKTLTKDIATGAVDAASGWTFKVATPAGYEKGKTADQDFSLATTVSRTTELGEIKTVGAVPAAAVKVKAKTETAADVLFYKDEIKTENKVDAGTIKFAYDGAAHKLVNNTVNGYTVTYALLNTSTGKYDDATECPSVTNVKDEITVKATIKDSYPSTDTRHQKDVEKVFTLGVEKAATPYFTFDEDGVVGKYEYAVEGAEYDAYGYIIAVEGANTDAAKAAVKANAEALAGYFKDFYEITAEATKADPNTFTFTVEPKKLSDAEAKELAKKYEDLMKNFGVTTTIPYIAPTKTPKLHINASNLIPEIEFVDSPTAVTYKAKKLKKKAASFTVTAVASNGQAVSYKLINAPAKIKIDATSGQITLAKKLKKGTYKIKVKAYLPTEYKMYDGTTGGNVYRQIFETQDIKVKVKK